MSEKTNVTGGKTNLRDITIIHELKSTASNKPEDRK